MPEPTRAKTLRLLHLGPEVADRLVEKLYAAKLAEYRLTLSDLRRRYGGPARVYLSTEIRDALLEEAERDAGSVVSTYNRLLDAEARRSPLGGQALFDHLAAYARERGRARSGMIARSTVAPARLDATVSFYMENGVEPQFDFVGPAPQCVVCRTLKETNPHPFREVLAIGIPHIQCSHRWRGRVYSAAKLAAGGIRPGKISAGAGPPAGIVGAESLREKLAGLPDEEVAAIIRSGELAAASLAKADWDPAEHPRDPRSGRFVRAAELLGAVAEALADVPNDEPAQPGSTLEEVRVLNEGARLAFMDLLDLGRGLQARLDADALAEDDLAKFEAAARGLRATERPVVVIPPAKAAETAAAKLRRKAYGPEGFAT